MNAAWSALINGGILSAVLAAAVWLALGVAPRRTWNASTRYLIWWITLAVALALPVLCALTVRPPVAVPSAASGSIAPRSIAGSVPAPVLGKPWTLPTAAWALEIPGGLWQPWLLAIWLVSSALLLLRLARSHAALVRASAAAEDAPDGLRSRAPAWCAAMGVDGGAVRVACSGEIAIPVALGPRRRAILIPARVLAELSEEELDHVGLHETAHLARRDDLALLAQRAIEALFYLHPVVRWIARRIDLEREIACDDMALAVTRNPRTYAACLTRMVELCGGVRESPAAANFAEYRPHLLQRVELIMKNTRNLSTKPLAAGLIGFAIALCALVGILVNRPALVAFAAPAPAPSPQRSTPDPATPGFPHQGIRLTVMLFDTTSMTAEALANASGTARNFVATRMQGALAAVMVYNGSGVDVRQDFTDDHDRIEQALRGLTASPGAAKPDAAGLLSAMRRAIEMTIPVDGKKALVFFSGGRPYAGQDPAQRAAVIDAAIRANLAIYMIDAPAGMLDAPVGRGR